MSSNKHLAKGSKQPSLNRGKLRLYSMRFCPFAQRVHLVLDAKKIPYDVVFINLTNKPEWFFEKNPLGKVPALEVEPNEILYESLIIADYLDEKYPQNRLYPTDPLQKAKDRILIEQFGSIIGAMSKLLYGSNRMLLDEQRDIMVEGLVKFEAELPSRGQYFSGNKPGMVDYMIWPWCERAELLKVFADQLVLKKDKFKRLTAWKALMCEDPAVKKSYLEPDVHMKYLESYRVRAPDYDLALYL